MEFELEADAQAVFGATITSGSCAYSQFKLRFEVITLEESVASMLADTRQVDTDIRMKSSQIGN